MQIPQPELLNDHAIDLAKIVAKTSYLPHPETVQLMNSGVFPTIRARRLTPRFTEIFKDGVAVGMHDDNATPYWALIWSHDLKGTRKKGWLTAHVWANANEIDSYTNLANLAFIPECFGGLTDKIGPLTKFLRWHSFAIYGWKPTSGQVPQKPIGYDEISWRYFDYIKNPKECVKDRLQRCKDKRIRILTPIMQRLGML